MYKNISLLGNIGQSKICTPHPPPPLIQYTSKYSNILVQNTPIYSKILQYTPNTLILAKPVFCKSWSFFFELWITDNMIALLFTGFAENYRGDYRTCRTLEWLQTIPSDSQCSTSSTCLRCFRSVDLSISIFLSFYLYFYLFILAMLSLWWL